MRPLGVWCDGEEHSVHTKAFNSVCYQSKAAQTTQPQLLQLAGGRWSYEHGWWEESSSSSLGLSHQRCITGGGAPFLPTALLPVLGFRFQPFQQRQDESPQSSSITAEPQGLNAPSLESTALAKGSGNRPVLHLELNIAARSTGPSRGSGNPPPDLLRK